MSKTIGGIKQAPEDSYFQIQTILHIDTLN